jgi:1-acyl-sn-glycerol-3-phosphate acyltransferase
MTGKTTDQGFGCLALIGSPPLLIMRAWRAFSITLSYVLFGLGCVGLALVTPWVQLTCKNRTQQIARLRAHASTVARWWMGYCRRVGAIEVHMINAEPLPPGLAVANHPSLVDAIWIIAAQPKICCVLKGDLQRAWLFRYLATHLDYVSNQDPELLLAEGCKRLKAGETLLVFPEATRTAPATLPQFRLGAGELAVRSQVAVHPIVIHKPGEYLSKGIPWHAFPDKKMHWEIVYHESVPPIVNATRRQARRRLTAQLNQFFQQQLSNTVVAQPVNPPEN